MRLIEMKNGFGKLFSQKPAKRVSREHAIGAAVAAQPLILRQRTDRRRGISRRIKASRCFGEPLANCCPIWALFQGIISHLLVALGESR
jgi:hypothetical protein